MVTTQDAGAASTPPDGSSCQVLVTFMPLAQVPQTAALVINQAGMSSSITLTVSRDVTLFYYLGIPAIAGGIMTILLLLLSLRIYVYDWDGQKLRRFSCRWLERPVLGSGAWALNDSWATNISTGLVVVSTVLATTSAANSLFPGVSLDRFAIVNIVAAAIVVMAPAVFGIYYALFTARNPGPTADATIQVPAAAAVSIKVPSGASITMSGDATVSDGAGNRATVRSGCTYQVPPGTRIDVRARAVDVQAALRSVLQAVLLGAMLAATEPAVWRRQPALRAAIEEVTAQEPVEAVARAAALAALVAQAAEVTAQQLAGQTDLPAAYGAGVAAGLEVFTRLVDREAFQAVRRDRPGQATRALWRAVKWRMVKRKAVRAVEALPERVVDAAVRAVMEAAAQADIAEAAQADIAEAVQADIAEAVQADIAEAVQADIAEAVQADIAEAVQAAHAQAGFQQAFEQAVQDAVEQQAVEAMAFPGTSDIGVQSGSTLEIQAPVGTWTIPASDQPVPWATPKPDDVLIWYPAHIDATGGAKITITGTADVTLPQHTVIAAPRRQTRTLPKERRLLSPQGTNLLVATMGMLVVANIFTMFGIGAELGIAGVLAYFSEATQTWRVVMFCAIAAVAVLVFAYAQTATRAMADPQPGSSLSSQAGTSFTL